MPHVFRSILVLAIAALYGGGLTLAQDDHADEGHHGGAEGTRLLVASTDSAELVVLDLGTGREIARFSTPGPGRAYGLPDEPRHAFVLHRDEHRVTVIHSGLAAVDHGDHADLLEGAPYVLQTLNLGRQPTGFFARSHDVGVFSEGDGTIAWLDTRLLGVSLDYVEIVTAGSDHGSLSIVDGFVLSGHQRLSRVDVYDRDGSLLATFDGCPGLGGGAVSGSTAVFGCSDGVLLVESHGGGTFSSHKIAAPATAPEGARIGTLRSDPGSDVVVGAFGDGVAIVDVAAREMRTVALPAAPLDMGFAEAGEVVLVLTSDGRLHRLDGATGEVEASVLVVPAAEPGMPQASLAVWGEFAYVADPAAKVVLEVHVDDMDVERRFELSITPGSLALMAIPGAALH